MSGETDVEILTTKNPAQWQEIIEQIGFYDFYHLPSFHRLAEIRGEGKAVMPVFRKDGYSLAFPMLLRDIDIPGRNKAAKIPRDATSVCGFAGPVSDRNLPEDIRQAFLSNLQAFFLEYHTVAAFCRLNPLTYDHCVLKGYGQTVDIGMTLSIDLTLPPETQWANYRSDHKRGTRRLQSKGYICEEAGIESLGEVFEIYHDTMRRLQAIPAFLYDRSYFEYLLNEMAGVMHLFVCRVGDSIAGFRLFSICGGIVSSYLSGTAEEFFRERPSGILYDAGRKWGNEIGARVMHLGGGMGAQRDTLYDFKKSFATNEHIYQTWRHVVDLDAYDGICRNFAGCTSSQLNTSYFPAYRDPYLKMPQKCLNTNNLVSEC